MLLWAGAQLNVSGVKSAALLCSAVYEGDMQLLRRLLRAGARADAEDYDKRTALHIAASDGNLPAVRGMNRAAQKTARQCTMLACRVESMF
jgi:ankyrin repeat protein